MAASVEHGTPALARGFHAAADTLADLEAVNSEAGRIVLARTQPPRGATGQLGANLRAQATGREVVMASTVRYFTFVHYGAPRINVHAQPFVLAALRASVSEVADLYAEHARDSLRKVP